MAAAADDDDVKHGSEVAVNYLDTRTFVESEEHARSIADEGRDVDDSSDSVGSAKSHVSFFSSVLQHLTPLLDSFEALVDIGDDDMECKSITGVSAFIFLSVLSNFSTVISARFCFNND